MKKKYYLVQIGVTSQSPLFLPYSVGCIASYLLHDSDITENYEIPKIIFRREPVEKALDRIVDPYIVAFSCFTWNIEYNKTLAHLIKQKYPDCIIVFGGHSISQDGESLNELSDVDFLSHNEGEESVAIFLKALAGGTDLKDVPNLSFRTEEGIVNTKKYIPCDISDYPSPYLDGLFDSLFTEYPDVEFHATLETSRGCSYDCAYCDRCFTEKVRQFPMNKIKKEIEWIATHKIGYCDCADANFGILKRDIDIAKYVVEQRKIYGYPNVFKPCYANECDDTVFETAYILNSNEADNGVTLACQSFDETTLANIGRKNLTFEHFSALVERYNNAGISIYTELLLGLPGETCESFCRGICRLLEMGQHNSMTVYECQVYSNARMGDKEYIKKFGIKTSRIPIFGIHDNPDFSGVNEYMDIVTSTDSMPKNDWVHAYMFAVILQTFHYFGLIRYFSLYLHHEKNIAYYDFYNKLYDYIFCTSDGHMHDFFVLLLERKTDTETADWAYSRDVFGSTGWRFEEGAFLEMVCHFDDFWKCITPFLASFDIENDIFSSLLDFQKSVIRRPCIDEIQIKSKYNFYPYFAKIYNGENAVLMRTDCLINIESPKKISDWETYAREIILFGKRYSASSLINPRNVLKYTQSNGEDINTCINNKNYDIPEYKSLTIILGATDEDEDLFNTCDNVLSICHDENIKILIVKAKDVTDGCINAIAKLKEKYGDIISDITQTRQYVGGAIRDGIDNTHTSHIMFLSSDAAENPDCVPQMIALTKQNPGCIFKASRWLQKDSFIGYSKLKKVFNFVAQHFLRMLYGGNLTDYTNPVQIIAVDILKNISLREYGFPFFLEVVLAPIRIGYKYTEIPVIYRKRKIGKSKNSLVQTLMYLKPALRVRFTPKKRLVKNPDVIPK